MTRIPPAILISGAVIAFTMFVIGANAHHAHDAMRQLHQTLAVPATLSN